MKTVILLSAAIFCNAMAGMGVRYFSGKWRESEGMTALAGPALTMKRFPRHAARDSCPASTPQSAQNHQETSSLSVGKAFQTPEGAARTHETVCVNTAGVDELVSLPGIGPVIAARIVEYRQAHGPFAAPESLLEVSGIGKVKLEAIRDMLRF